ncbi:hypothetical protein DSO57_1004852 [Entomophthora muscae]|uniref:Uncharacterized protein n=1 Tax=Entomophthora muscae TaxID=34485 RepID=A0ACC2RZ80_9FUNG|nr:hypothetical protein DSO57_1004852 [Entomophthora muscae]
MHPPQQYWFNLVLLAIGCVAVPTNILVVWMAWRLRHRSIEIRIALILALVDMLLAGLIVLTSLLNLGCVGLFHSFRSFCRFKGPVDFILLYVSLVLVSLIAITRYFKVKSSSIPHLIWVIIVACTSLYGSVICIAAAKGEFSTSLSGFDCTPIATNSIISAVVQFSLGFFMFVSFMAGLFAYLGILSCVDTAHDVSCSTTHRPKLVLIRVACILLTNLSLVAPSSVLIMLEGSRNSNESNLLSSVVSILVALNILANPCLVLFAHSGISKNLMSFFNSPFSHICYSPE